MWTRCNVFRYIACCIINLVILFNLFKLHSRWSCNYAYEGTANVHLQFMDGLPAARYNVNYFVQLSTLRWATISNTLMCILHKFSSIKARFSHIQALLLDYILALAKNTRTPCVHFVFIYESIFLNIFKPKCTTKSTVFHSVPLGSCPRPCSKRADMLYYYFHIKEEHFEMFFTTNLYQNIH